MGKNLIAFLAIISITTIVILAVTQNTARFAEDTSLTAHKTSGSITLDGIAKEGFWSDADDVKISDIDDSGVDITILAKHDGTNIFVYANWTDDTKDSIRKQWEFNGTHWINNGLNEDRLSFVWTNTSNEIACGHESGTGFQFDVWHWKATRTDPAGWADDKYWDGDGRQSDGKDSGGYSDNSVVAQMSGNTSTEITSVLQNTSAVNAFKAGDLPYWDDDGDVIQWDTSGLVTTNSTTLTNTIGGQPTTKPVGSRGDVVVGSKHTGDAWHLEYKRKLDTGHSNDDIIFEEGNSYTFYVSFHNRSGDSDHFKSETAFTLEISSVTGATDGSAPGFIIAVGIVGIVTLVAFKRKKR